MTGTRRRQPTAWADLVEFGTVRFSLEVESVVSIKVIMFELSPFAPGDRQSRHQQLAPVAVVQVAQLRAATG
jgi:hypothetical protein